MIATALRELRYAFRGLRRDASFTIACVVTLGLGVGATTAVFCVIYGLVFRPLPFPNAERLVQVVQLVPTRPGATTFAREGLTPEQITEWRATSRTLSTIGYYLPQSVSLTGIATPVRLNGAMVSVPLFRGLGVSPLIGRLFDEDDELEGNQNVLILAYGTWSAHFGRAADVVGQLLMLNDRQYRVIGIMPDSFGFPSLASARMSLNSKGELDDSPEFWTPIPATPRPAGPATGGMSLFPTLALLEAGVGLEQPTAEANTLMAARAGQKYRIELVSAQVEQATAVRPILELFQGAVLLVFLIACINILNLLIARSARRSRELLIRQAIGASRSQLARYGLVEGAILGIGGGVIGCLLAYFIVAAFRAMPPFLLPRMADVRPDWTILASAFLISLVAGGVIGAASTLRIVASDSFGGAVPAALSATRFTRPSGRAPLLAMAEAASGVLLLTCAGLLLTSFVRLTNVDRGFDPNGVYSFRVALPARYQATAAQYGFHDQLQASVRRIPGVASVGASSLVFGRGGIGYSLSVAGERSKTGVAFQVVTPGLFQTLGIPVEGREFRDGDRLPRAAVAVVNQTFARLLLGPGNAVGRTVSFQSWPELTIIGVAQDTRTQALETAVTPTIYLPQQLDGSGFVAAMYFVRTSSTRSLLSEIRAFAGQIEPAAVIFDATWLHALLGRTVAARRLYTWTAIGFAAVAVILAVVGLYGVLAHSVRGKTREIGVRIALGASRRTVMWSVMREGMLPVVVGVLIGMAGSLYLSRFLGSLLFGVGPRDPVVLLGVGLLFLAISGMTCYLPAARATRVDPVVALRLE